MWYGVKGRSQCGVCVGGVCSQVNKFEQVHVVAGWPITRDLLPCEQTEWQTDITENITFPQSTYAGGNNDLQVS